ncbi:hypothetical protein GUJ93_ZPchr0010g7618 [Zizania palustris]|uniref:Protein kinase domain-containing protein n=1 Tax=Zizania palustris TaxID=103762 RepID=A0A8J6BNB9_ZIZPA|nr:hypothetical protein GUJ93_ZPchr0010g7618 [Zizania palustris]
MSDVVERHGRYLKPANWDAVGMHSTRSGSSMSPLLILIVLSSLASAAASLIGKPGCQTTCGGVDIPYPFGIGTGIGVDGVNVNCSLPGFEISCVDNHSGGLMPVLANNQIDIDIEVLNLTVMPRPEARVQLPVSRRCYDNATGNVTDELYNDLDLNPAGVYRISDAHNELVVLGCNTLVYTNSGPAGGEYRNSFYTGCISYCKDERSAQDGMCAGVGCCHVDIPPNLADNKMTFGDESTNTWSRINQPFSPCDYAFFVEKDHYQFKASDLTTMPESQEMPVLLDWAIRSNISAMSCAEAKTSPGYACVSQLSKCLDSTNGPGYFCNCTRGYEGNPYIVDGCTNINECERPEDYPCYGVCEDTEGSYDCKCPRGKQINSGSSAKEQQCSPKFPLAAQLALGTSLGVSFLIVSLLCALMVRQKRKMNEYFKKNGGSILKKVENIKIFDKDELNKITRNNSEVLGQGGFGKVYKGILADNTIVAVKASIEVNDARKEDFTNEVIIQSQMIHTNIIKLLGCCLEVDVPMLVYEFAANGNLQDILHADASRRVPLPLELRLDIAIESAEGLRYMHSSAKRTVRHGDVKPANILLDDKFVPKISDFGTSKLLTVDKDFTMFVVGSMGYIDPVFHKTGHLTKKSDVYSFGVVLLELICRKPTIYGENLSLIIEFQKAYEEEDSGRRMFDKEIMAEENISTLEEMGKLAMECLREKVEERPDMKEVAERLVMLRRARKQAYGQGNYIDEIGIEASPKSASSSATLSTPSTPATKHTSNP